MQVSLVSIDYQTVVWYNIHDIERELTEVFTTLREIANGLAQVGGTQENQANVMAIPSAKVYKPMDHFTVARRKG